MKLSAVKISQALAHEDLFASVFKDPATWVAWRAFLMALFGQEMTDEELDIYRECTGRSAPPTTQAAEGWLICGRRSGKSRTLALVSVFLAIFKPWQENLGPGERGIVMVLASDRKQSKVILNFIKGILAASETLKAMIEVERQESIDLRNMISIEIHTSSYRTIRGRTVVAALADEVAFWPSDTSSEPADEVLSALRPSMATVPGAMLLVASSPYARQGVLWDAYRKHFGQDGDIIVWQAPTRRMNPTVPQSFIDRALAEDHAKNSAEYLAVFRIDIEGYITREVVEACIDQGVHERARLSGVRYVAFVDPSGGSADSFTMAIAHKERDGRIVLDVLREVIPPFSPELVVADYAKMIKAYGIRKVTGDRYGGEWVTEAFKTHNLPYDASAAPKSDLYRDMLPYLNSGRAALLDHTKLINQILGLERRVARSGRDSIDHGPRGHDDLANAAAGALVAVSATGSGYTLANILEDDRIRAKQLDEPRSDGRWTEGELLMRAIVGLKQ